MSGFRIAGFPAFVGFLMCLAVSTAAPAKSLYIERWGANDPNCGPRASPCQTISHALSIRARKNDRLIVGPGHYPESVTITGNGFGPLEGVRLESTAGRFATIIESISNIVAAVNVSQPRVRVGKKGKGFSLIDGLAGVLVANSSASSARIEGNFLSANTYGISATGAGHQVRYNLIKGNTSEGLICSSCDKLIVQENHISNNSGAGIYLLNSIKTITRSNLLLSNGINGILLGNGAKDNKVLFNVFSGNTGHGAFVDNVDSTVIQGNVAAQNSAGGALIDQDTFDKAPILQSNLAIKNGGYGMRTESLSAPRMDRNATIQNNTDGFQVAPVTGFVAFTENNSIDDGSGCGINNQAGIPVTYLKQYFKDAGICGIHDPFSTTTSKPNAVNVNQARKL